MNTFYAALLSPEEKYISLAGGGGKSVLIHKICQECVQQDKTVVVMSIFPLYIPLESKTVISTDTDIIKTQVERELEKNNPVYLGSKFGEKRIEGFKPGQVKKLLPDISADHIFIKADNTQGRSISGLDNFNISVARETQRLIFVLGAEAFNQEKQEKFISTSDAYWKSKTALDPVDIADWYLNHKVFKTLAQKKIPMTIFINMVEDIFHENLTIAFARKIKLAGIDRVVYGSIFNSEFHIVK